MNTKKILIVDDDMDLINVVSTILENEGYEMVTANNKKEGLAVAKAEKPDLAILDVMMTTHYEGFEMAQSIINDEELSKMPILMQTSIDVLTTTNASVRDMAREYRQNPEFKDLQVILLKDNASGKAGVDYKAEDGKSIWLPVTAYLKKPVDAKKLIATVTEVLNTVNA
jgi:twitching motility two-component system response regulator PilH